MTSAARRVLLCIVISQAILAPRNSPAESDFTSKTYIKFFKDAADNSYAPLYEYIEMENRDPERGLWNMYLSGWWGHDFGAVQYDGKNRDELTNAFFRFAPCQDKRLVVNAGRHIIYGGVISQQIDGLSASWEVTPQAGFSMFGGSPVETEFDARGGDLAYGGRAYQRIDSRAELGLSYLQEKNSGAPFREEAGLDVWLLPLRGLEVKGHSFYNNITEGWAEHAYTLRVFPGERLILSGLFSRTSYNDAFSARTLSVFSPDFLGQGETLTKQGGLIEYRAGDTLTWVVDYTHYAYRMQGEADGYGGKGTVTALWGSSGLSLHRMEGSEKKLRYLESRFYLAADRGDWRLSFDTVNLHYDAPFAGVADAYSVNGTVQYAISDSLSSAFSVEYGKNPDFVNDTTVLVNLVYRYKQGR